MKSEVDLHLSTKSATIEWLHVYWTWSSVQVANECFIKCNYFISDEKKQYDPSGFRDAILEGLEAAGSDLDAVSKFLDVSGSKLDYRRYGVNLIEILIAGGLLGT